MFTESIVAVNGAAGERASDRSGHGGQPTAPRQSVAKNAQRTSNAVLPAARMARDSLEQAEEASKSTGKRRKKGLESSDVTGRRVRLLTPRPGQASTGQ